MKEHTPRWSLFTPNFAPYKPNFAPYWGAQGPPWSHSLLRLCLLPSGETTFLIPSYLNMLETKNYQVFHKYYKIDDSII